MGSAHTSSLFNTLPTYQSLLSHTKMLVLPARGSGSDLCSYHSTYLPTYQSQLTQDCLRFNTTCIASSTSLYLSTHIHTVTTPITCLSARRCGFDLHSWVLASERAKNTVYIALHRPNYQPVITHTKVLASKSK